MNDEIPLPNTFLCSVHTEWRQRQRYRSPCEHLHSFALNPFKTTPLQLPLQCEHPHLIALNPFIGNNIVAVVVTQCEWTFNNNSFFENHSFINILCKIAIYLNVIFTGLRFVKLDFAITGLLTITVSGRKKHTKHLPTRDSHAALEV